MADIMELKRMMEKLGQAKTHLELKKMIAEVDTNNSGQSHTHTHTHTLISDNTDMRKLYFLCAGTIHYNEFLDMMLGKKSTVLKL